MKNIRYLLDKQQLQREEQLTQLVENKLTYTLKDCEFSIYETHKTASNVRLHFNDLAFTGMLRGKKNMSIEGKTTPFEYLPGESVLMAPGETMLIDFPEADENPTQCISLSFSPDFVKETLNMLNGSAPKLDEASNWNLALDDYYIFNTPSLASATNNIIRIAMDSNLYKDTMADFALKELLLRLMQTQARNLVEKSRISHSTKIGFITNYINQNLHQKLSIDSIAKMAYVSKSNLFKIFKEELGISPNDYILQQRIKKAKQLLESSENIKDVAFKTGFSDTNYFTRVFRQQEGVTPKLFQNNSVLKID